MDRGTPREQVGRAYVGLCELLYAPWRGQHITPAQEEAFRAAVIACLELRGHLESETEGEPQAACERCGERPGVASAAAPGGPDWVCGECGDGAGAAPRPFGEGAG